MPRSSVTTAISTPRSRSSSMLLCNKQREQHEPQKVTHTRDLACRSLFAQPMLDRLYCPEDISSRRMAKPACRHQVVEIPPMQHRSHAPCQQRQNKQDNHEGAAVSSRRSLHAAAQYVQCQVGPEMFTPDLRSGTSHNCMVAYKAVIV